MSLRDRLPPTPRSVLRAVAVAAVVAQAGIAVTGSVVRVTGSGLGCPTWPECFPGSMVPTPHPEVEALTQWIEFGNRLLTGVVVLVAAACVVAAWGYRPRNDRIVRLAWLQPIGVLTQAVVGGFVVRSQLVWWSVGLHFLISVVFVWLAVQLVCAVDDGDGPAVPVVPRAVRGLVATASGVLGLLVMAGTLVTAAGPHSGDADTPRLALGVPATAQLHADLVFAYLGLLVGLGFALRAVGVSAPLWRRYLVLAATVLAQGALGGVQYALGVPEVLVALHVLGSMLVVMAASAVWAGTSERLRSADRVPDAGSRRVEA
ncbi:MAG: COX15/CtaA family protein [Pseudonocardia sp.]|nr:COX15/CtaA family protein [Pseudonocardia sp.]